MERSKTVTDNAVLVSAIVMVTLWAHYGSALGAVGAVLRYWIFAFAIASLLGITMRAIWRKYPRAGIALAMTLALFSEITAEIYWPAAPSSADDATPCYDKQGRHDC